MEHRFKRFRDGVKAGIWQKSFDAVSGQLDMEYAMVDATIVKVHRHGQGAGLKARPWVTRTGGVSTRIRVLCDALGNLVMLVLIDKAFDVQWLIERLQAQGVPIVISQRSNLMFVVSDIIMPPLFVG